MNRETLLGLVGLAGVIIVVLNFIALLFIRNMLVFWLVLGLVLVTFFPIMKYIKNY